MYPEAGHAVGKLEVHADAVQAAALPTLKTLVNELSVAVAEVEPHMQSHAPPEGTLV